MADWRLKIDLSDFWHKYPDEITLQEVSKKLIFVLGNLKKIVAKRFPDYLDELESIIDDFQPFVEDETMHVDDFDYVLSNLYDWADTHLDDKSFGGKKLCWIDTFGKSYY